MTDYLSSKQKPQRAPIFTAVVTIATTVATREERTGETVTLAPVKLALLFQSLANVFVSAITGVYGSLTGTWQSIFKRSRADHPPRTTSTKRPAFYDKFSAQSKIMGIVRNSCKGCVLSWITSQGKEKHAGEKI